MPELAAAARRLDAVRDAIRRAAQRASRDPATVRLVCVSKTRPQEQTRALHELGLRDFAENRVQEARAKAPLLPADIAWHVIGRLQTNKAKYLPEFAAWLHALDRLDLAEALEKAFAKAGRRLPVLVQVNVAGEEQKGGVAPGDAEGLLRACAALPHLDVRGLMAMAPYSDDPEDARPTFRGLRLLAQDLRARTRLALPELSMGMSGDYEVAIEEGATMVRVGTALYQDPGS